MFVKIRKKFICVSIFSVFLVLLIILGTINIINYTRIVNDADMIVYVLKENNGEFGNDHGLNIPAEIPFSTRYFTVTLTENGDVRVIDLTRIVSVTSKEAVAYARELFEEGKSSGFYKNFRYGVSELPNGEKMYIFVDRTVELENFHGFLLSSIFIGLAGTAVVFILIFIFSDRIMQPVAESYRKQKQFITDAGHELKTPLTIIGANTEVIEMQGGESEWTKGIKEQISRLTSLTEKLIFLAKMEEQNDLPMFEFSLSDVIEESIQEFSAMAASKGIELVFDVQKGVFYTGNEEMIRRMISLLADNAIKYTDGNVVTFSLRTEGNKKVIEVKNPASYIAEGDMSGLFERFARGDISRNSGTGRHGIGLSVVRVIAEAHNGRLKGECRNGIAVITAIL